MKADYKKIPVIFAAVYIAAVLIGTVFTIFTDAPASSFEYTADKGGGITLTAYKGHRFAVNIPTA